MQAPESGKTLTKLAQSFGNTISRVLTDLCGRGWKMTVSDQPPTTTLEGSQATSIAFTFSGGLEGEAALALSSAELSAMSIKGANSAEDAAKLLISALDMASASWSQTLNEYGAVAVSVPAVAHAESANDHLIELLGYAEGSSPPVSFLLSISARLLSAAQTVSARSLAYPAPTPSANLDLVLDVELNVTLRFGQRQLSLREVLDLTSGSVVELDRQVDEPVELVLDGRVVARGEAVIIDGVYGMRITQVLQPLVA